MAEINQQSLSKHLEEAESAGFYPVYLIYGEPYLCRKACQNLLDAMIPDDKARAQSVTAVEHGEPGQVAEILEQLNTLSFFSSRQAAVLRNATVFTASKNRGDAFKKIKKAYDAGNTEKAAELFLRLLGQAHMALEDASPKTLAETFQLNASGGSEAAGDLDWLESLASYCINQGLSVPSAADDAALLEHAVKRGFPKGHHLILTAESVDKRTGLYKAVAAGGCVVDCSVSMSARKKDREMQQKIVFDQAREVLAASGKKMGSRAMETMYELIGFDLNAFTRGLEKLIAYTGERKVIEVEDIRAVLTKSREAPIYELTGAVADKNALAAMARLNELLNSGYHYLQILMALTNQLRRLLLVKGFINSPSGNCWQPGMPYNRFKDLVMPKIQEYDKNLQDMVGAWSEKEETGGGKQKKKAAIELVIARQPNNPYPVYQQFLKAANFSEAELKSAFFRLHEADVALKSTGRNPEFVLEEVMLGICGRRGNEGSKALRR